MVETEFIQAFIEETESYLPTIRGGILIFLQEGKNLGELELSLQQIHTVKGAALMIGLEEIGNLAGVLETEINSIIHQENTNDADQVPKMLDILARIEQLLLEARLSDTDFSFEMNDFVDESFENLQSAGQPPAESNSFGVDEFEQFPQTIQAEADDDFEIDDEMLEIFAMEAEDLLRSISVNLEILENQPNDREALLEVRRNAHTLKGSAGIVGLKKLSELAHRVEDLLDYVAEKDIPGSETIFRLLLASTDCLSAMTSGENSESLHAKINQIYSEFDALTTSLENPKTTETSEIPPSAAVIELPKTNFAPVEIPILEVPEIEETALPESQNNKLQPPKSVIRVSLEKLDDLVKVMRGMVGTRSIFEQRIGELDRQIEELSNSTRRLQRLTAKLETDFEADMLSVQSAPAASPNYSSAHNNPSISAVNPHAFDSLEFDRYTEFHQTTRELVETTNDALSINAALDGLRGNLESLYDSQYRLIEEMQDKLLRIRMVSFGSLTARLQRTVRVTCDEEGKQAELFIEGENLEVDTQILDALTEPLLHLLRNAIAHGIESPDTRRILGKPEKGRIRLRAQSEGTHIILTISDDGRGISASGLKEKAVQSSLISRETSISMSEEEAFELIFLPGVTTAEKLSQTAGRGVGMDIVRTTVERRQGTISIKSEPQKGTIFTIRLPMALAVTRALLVKVGSRDFALPLGYVKQITEASCEMREKANREKYLQFGEIKYTLSHLNDLLGFPLAQMLGETDNAPLLLVDTPENARALIVDTIVKSEEIVIKPLGFPLQNIQGLLGGAILGDGRVVPVLDLFYLLGKKKKTLQIAPKTVESNAPKKEIVVMIVDDSPSVRHLNSHLVKKAGFQHLIAKDGLEALEILQTSKILPDIILTDVEMPRMDGYELLSSLKRQEILSAIPVVMITSRASEKHRQKAFELGVSDYLTKPYDDAKLIEAIKKLT